jgi:parvulin-like peptidyl-prolyl isomerase
MHASDRLSFQTGVSRLALTLILVAAWTEAATAQATRPVAVVNGEPITLADVDAIFKARSIESMKLTADDYREMRKESLNMLIDERLVQQFLRKSAPAVSPAQVNRSLRELQGALKAQGQTMDEYLRANDQTEAQVRDAIITGLQWKAYLDRQLNEATLLKYYEANRDVFDQVSVRVRHIVLRVTPAMTPAQREEAKSRLLGIRQEIVSGKLNFCDAARSYSQDTSASQGGDLGEIARKGAVEESFARAAFALKPNEISDVVQTASGFHLVVVTERKIGSPSTFKASTAKIRELAGEEILCDILAQQRASAHVTVKLDEVPVPKVAQAGSTRPF